MMGAKPSDLEGFSGIDFLKYIMIKNKGKGVCNSLYLYFNGEIPYQLQHEISFSCCILNLQITTTKS